MPYYETANFETRSYKIVTNKLFDLEISTVSANIFLNHYVFSLSQPNRFIMDNKKANWVKNRKNSNWIKHLFLFITFDISLNVRNIAQGNVGTKMPHHSKHNHIRLCSVSGDL